MAGHNRISSLQLAQQLSTRTQGKRREIPDQRTMRFFADAFLKLHTRVQELEARKDTLAQTLAENEKLHFEVLSLRNECVALRKSNTEMRRYKSKTDPTFNPLKKR